MIMAVLCLLLVACFVMFTSLHILRCDITKKEAETLNVRVQQLTDLVSKSLVLRLNGDKYRKFVTATPRNYSMIVMFTVLDTKRECDSCKHASDEFQIAANSFRYSHAYSNKIFFGIVDFNESPDVFQSLKLNSVPTFMHFPAQGKPEKDDRMDIQRIGFDAEIFARWVHERTDIQFQIFRARNNSRKAALFLLFAMIGGLLYLGRNYLDFLYNKTTWTVIAMTFTFAMTSGQMWNHIRQPAFLYKSHSGQVSFVHGSSQRQFVIETYLVIFLNFAIVFGMIAMCEAASSKGDIKKRRILTIVGLALATFFFSLILSIFKSKAHGYPYSFLFD